MKKTRKYGLIAIVIGILAIIGGEILGGLVIVGIGAFLKFWKFNKHQEISEEIDWSNRSADLYDNVPQAKELEFFIAHSDKFRGFQQMVDDWNDQNAPYEGLSDKELQRKLRYTHRIYRNGISRYSGIMLVDEPTNKYNPAAIKVVSDEYGHLGYISDSDLDEIRELRKHNNLFYVKFYGGDYKELVDDTIITGNYTPKGRLIVRAPIE